jgi:hypothetical protein
LFSIEGGVEEEPGVTGQLPHLRKAFGCTARHETAVVGFLVRSKTSDGSAFETHILALPGELKRRSEL